MQELIESVVTSKIILIRGQKVLLDSDLAELYGVSVKRLNEAVKRNRERFPIDFMFQLTDQESKNVRSQFATAKYAHTKRRFASYVFTEHGVAMLSSVLKSERAILVNIEIMRIFGKLRQILASNKDLAERLGVLEKKYGERFRVVFEAIRELMQTPEPHKELKIGFHSS